MYTEKLDTICQSLENHCKEWIEFEKPKGGLYVWCTLKPTAPFEANDVEMEAIARGLVAPDGNSYFLPPNVDGSPGATRAMDQRHLRLCFAGPTLELLEEAGRRLGEACAAAEAEALQEVAETADAKL